MSEKDKYRRDIRDEQQFTKDIREGTDIERIILEKFIKILKQKLLEQKSNSGKFIVVSTGCGNSGKWLPPNQISTKADYRINGKLLEIKFSRPFSTTFHWKVSQIRSYIQQNASLLFVNGYGEEKPKYIYLTTIELIALTRKYQKVIYWDKETYEIPAKDFDWEDFK